MLSSNNLKWNPSRKLIQDFIKKFPKVSFLRSTDNIATADVIFGWILDEKTFKIAKNLKWFHTAGIQYGHLQPVELYKKAVVTNSRGVWKEHLADTVIDSLQKIVPLKNLKNKTACIIGFGENGSEIAKRLSNVGMKIIAVKRKDRFTPSRSKADLTPRGCRDSDLTVLAVPLTDETKNLLNKKNLKLLKKSSIIISTSRPEAVNNDDLMKALESGHIKAAIIDTMWPEKYQTHKNVITFKHMSPEDYDIWPKMFEIFGENLKRFLNGKELLNRINP